MAVKTRTTTTVGAKKQSGTTTKAIATGRGKPEAAAKTKVTKKTTTAKKTTAARKAKPVRVTLGSLSDQIATLSAELATITQTLATLLAHLSPKAAATLDAELTAPAAAVPDYATFETDLLATMGTLDRTGRHAGLVPVPELRIAFLERGWARAAFDERLLQAERDFIVDLKVADDPLTLANPELAIQERGRGYLQYAVAR